MIYSSLLEAQWGPFEKDGHCLTNGKMPFISEQTRLNMLFPVEEDVSEIIQSKVADKFGCNIPSQLAKFYSANNGCRLFFSSLNVFGIQKYANETYQPFDLFVENNHILGRLKNKERGACNLVFFASIGGTYAFGFDKTECQKIYGIKKGSLMIVQEFADFNTFFEHYFSNLMDEYGTDCRKKHPAKEFEGIPVLEHQTNTIL